MIAVRQILIANRIAGVTGNLRPHFEDHTWSEIAGRMLPTRCFCLDMVLLSNTSVVGTLKMVCCPCARDSTP
jgi:hypothetical protein